jgi:Bacteriophage tail sheath protein
MATSYLHPGVYVQEVSSGVHSIEGVSTSTAAFVGVADRGPIPGTILPGGQPAQPLLVNGFTEYERNFGGFRNDSFLTYAARAFFDNGGQRLYVVRVTDHANPARRAAAGGITSPPSTPFPIAISAANEGAWGNNIWVTIENASDFVPSSPPVAPATFKLTVMYAATTDPGVAKRSVVEVYDGVTFADPSPSAALPSNYVGTLVNRRSEYISITARVVAQPSLTATPVQLGGGFDGAVPSNTSDYTGVPSADGIRAGTGLHALDNVTDVNIIAIPGIGDSATINFGVAYCKISRPLQDCFFVADVGTLDPPGARLDSGSPNVPTVAGAKAFAITGSSGGPVLDRSAGDYGALYFPWVYAADPIGTGRNPRILLPPSGFIAGIYARTDASRGVFKAPAGTEAGLAGALGPATMVGDIEQDSLNPNAVNVIRTVPGSGLVVWGARTFASNAEWRYVPVRRMAIFLRVSIYYGIQWAVFEPNDEPLWSSLRLNIRSFMLTQFRAGAFQGAKPDEAFFVKCDTSTTTQQDIDNGVVNILVGFAPLKPAEFIVLKLSQKVNQPAA